jgi:hypothetical protein
MRRTSREGQPMLLIRRVGGTDRHRDWRAPRVVDRSAVGDLSTALAEARAGEGSEAASDLLGQERRNPDLCEFRRHQADIQMIDLGRGWRATFLSRAWRKRPALSVPELKAIRVEWNLTRGRG